MNVEMETSEQRQDLLEAFKYALQISEQVWKCRAEIQKASRPGKQKKKGKQSSESVISVDNIMPAPGTTIKGKVWD